MVRQDVAAGRDRDPAIACPIAIGAVRGAGGRPEQAEAVPGQRLIIEWDQEGQGGMHTTRSKLNIVVFLALAVGVLFFIGLAPFPAFATEPRQNADAKGFAGSQSCRECHERFYQL